VRYYIFELLKVSEFSPHVMFTSCLRLNEFYFNMSKSKTMPNRKSFSLYSYLEICVNCSVFYHVVFSFFYIFGLNVISV
jgi:hypothetical protein